MTSKQVVVFTSTRSQRATRATRAKAHNIVYVTSRCFSFVCCVSFELMWHNQISHVCIGTCARVRSTQRIEMSRFQRMTRRTQRVLHFRVRCNFLFDLFFFVFSLDNTTVSKTRHLEIKFQSHFICV